MKNKRSMNDLRQLQALPLRLKILMTKARIRDWINEFGEDGVYVSFSGGKDSTVLLDLVREDYPDVPSVFCDTGLEYPEIRDFVKTFDNVVWLKPKMTFRQVIEKYGYPFISKEVAHKFHDRNTAIRNGHSSYLDEQLKGSYISKNGKTNMVDITKYYFLVDSPFNISHKCCDVMKKNITKEYEKQTGRKAIIGQMACESLLRKQMWLRFGCNAFEKKRMTSSPMSFWTEQDVLYYIKTRNIKICSVYGDIVEDMSKSDQVEGQLTISDIKGFEEQDMFDAPKIPLKTTRCKRTGCMFCGFGCHNEKPGEGRFERMKETHPKQYAYIMKPWDEGGLGYKEVIDWLNENGNLNIKY